MSKTTKPDGQGQEPEQEQPDSQDNAPDGQDNAPDGQKKPAPFATFPDERSFARRMDREARKRLNEAAKAVGYDDWTHMQEELGKQKQQPGDDKAAPRSAANDDSERLRLALQVASELNLPATLVGRLQGASVDEMRADAKALVGLLGKAPGTPGIPGVPEGGKPTTFTQAQLRDPVFVREHRNEILVAAREGRIVKG